MNLEAYDADRADFDRVLEAIRLFQESPLTKLHDLRWVYEVVCSVGLGILHPAEEIYADEAYRVNSSHQGITQYPIEFARWLLLLSERPVNSYLEIGCYNGGTACLATAYLHRLNRNLRVITADVTPWFIYYPQVARLIPLEYHVGKTSYDFAGRTFDAVFIDGDHSFPWAMADFRNVGKHAGICGIHDIKSRFFLENEPLGGVTAAWEVIQREHAGEGIEFIDICEHPTEYFGIGVRRRQR